jgi:hypothetical protein
VLWISAGLALTPSAWCFDLFGLSIDTTSSSKNAPPEFILIGDPVDSDVGPERPGRVWVVSAKDGRPVSFVDGDRPGDRFGSTVAFIDDIDGDGVPEFAASATRDFSSPAGTESNGTRQGYIKFCSGKTGRVLYSMDVPVRPGVAPALASISDWDGDGKRDLVIGLPAAKGDGRACGRVEVVSSQGFKTIVSISGPTEDQGFGVVVASGGDLDSDGLDDIAVSAIPDYSPQYPVLPSKKARADGGIGDVFLISSKSRRIVRNLSLHEPGAFGTSLCIAGSSVYIACARTSGGSSVMVSRTDEPVREWHRGDAAGFGWGMAAIADIDHDGVGDLCVSSAQIRPGDNTPGVFMLSGKTSKVLYHVDTFATGPLYSMVCVARLGDINGDGVADVTVSSAPIEGWVDNRGSVHVLSGVDGKPLLDLTRWRLQEGLRAK